MGLFDEERTIEVEIYQPEKKQRKGFIKVVSLIATAVLCSVAIFYAVWEVVISSIFSAESSILERILGIVILTLPAIVGYIHGRRIYYKAYKFGKIWFLITGSATLIPTIITSIPIAIFNKDSGMSTGNFILVIFLLYLCIAAVVGLVTSNACS